MNYTLFTEKILSIARSLAAMQLLADHDGDGDGPHPLTPLLDDFRKPVVRQLMLQAYIDMTLNLRRYIDDAYIPEPDSEFDRFTLSIITPSGFGSVEADLLLAAMEQFIALSTAAAVLRSWHPDDLRPAEAFSTLAAEYLAKALSLISPQIPRAITPCFG
ncbi:MAG: hypothetical protein HDS51_01615 [Barnesiella sp.]|nr:hypothetical protein [Barnesiella sp.]